MKHRHLRSVIIFGSVVLLALMLVQGFWLNRVVNITERQFSHDVNLSLNAVAVDLAIESGTPVEVNELKSNFYFVPMHTRINHSQLDALIQREFAKRGLDLPYEIGVYAADRDTLVYGNYVRATLKNPNVLDEKPSSAPAQLSNFAVYFPSRLSYMAGEMKIWLFSTVTLLLMVGFFAFAIVSLLKEKRYADMKNDFISNMTHELKTPVTNIKIAHEILSQSGEGKKAYLDIIDKANRNLEEKIDQVLMAASIEQTSELKLEKLDLHEIIRECAENFKIRIEQRHGVLSLELEAHQSEVYGDRAMLIRAFENLIDNAEKYSSDEPVISLKSYSNNGQIELRVADQGMGIPEPLQEKVFDRFFRVAQGDRHNVKGFGLGLNFVRSVFKSHKGAISLMSRIDQGTEIRVTLPLA